ncbi:MAG: HAMP domain-containing protein [Actinobacteria bacterium]|nr:MAG: HAMP domain-containing protein [Actinomycetota bacterium]
MTTRTTWMDSYRLRLILGYVLVVSVLAGAWAWSLYGPLTDAVIEQQQAHLQSVAQAGVLVVARTPGVPEQTVRELVARTDLRMTLVAADGTVLADSAEDPSAMGNHGDRPEIVAALEGTVGRDVRRSATQGIEQMYVAVPATYEGQRVALRVSESLEKIGELSAGARRTGLILLALSVLLALVLGARTATTTARPVERLADAACAMASGDLVSSVPAETGALEPLSAALSQLRTQMRSRIDDLEVEQRNLRAVLDGLSDAVFLLDGRQVRLVNRAATTMFRPPAAEMRGRDIAETGLPASLASAISDALATGAVTVREAGPDPLQRYFRLTVVPLAPAEDAARHLVVIADITDRMRLDSVRREFVANASHELKTPTSAILLLSEGAANAASDGDTDQALAFLGQIEAEAARLRQLVLDLLDLSRLERAPDSSSVTDLRHAIDLSLAAHRRAAGAKGLELTADFSAVEGIDVYARSDSTDLAVALDNLLANAISYTETGSVNIALAANEATVTFSVNDTGIGIPAEDLPRVFERFYRVDRSRTRDSGGTGLGLALVRHVVERADGTVEITSSPGAGTTVTVTLPRAV